MRVLIADKLPDQARSRLAAAGCEVRLEPSLSGDTLTAEIKDFDPDVLIVRSTKVIAQHFAGRLGLVVRAGAGYNNIDLAAASDHGVYVANCPGKNAAAVAELAIGLLVTCDRRIPDNVAALREGRWAKGEFSKANGLKDRTLGILGCGSIGLAVARRAQALGMEVLAWSRSLTDEMAAEHGLRRYDTPEDVARRANALSVHLALTPETRGFVGESIFAEMKHGAIFLNTSRAEVVDEDALLRALDEREIIAGLDVFSDEPAGKAGSFDHALARHPRVYGTHHIGASTAQAQEAVAAEACHIVEAFKDTGLVPNCVNLGSKVPRNHVVSVRHRDRVGVLAAVLGVLSRADLNVGAMENRLFDGGEGAIARIHVDARPSPEVGEALCSLDHVLAVDIVDLET
ncbi:MAG: ACT domain-containing protein [Deltaproteobacteria bacterium]|nr:MAG: ACT domain-containing protein [Deltaproteobacteria bacterium]